MLYPNPTGLENLDFLPNWRVTGTRPDELRALLSRAGLPVAAHAKPLSTYSKGMRQKVDSAIALAKQANALLPDEPTSGLDPKAINEFSELLTGLAQEGAAILMATHDIFRAKEVGTQNGIMRAGHLVETLPTTDLTANELEAIYRHTV